jgi:hypothetical protein
MTRKNETYIGDGLYASYDGFALWLRAPREHGDHEVALEPDVLYNFLNFAFTIQRTANMIRKAIHERPFVEIPDDD